MLAFCVLFIHYIPTVMFNLRRLFLHPKHNIVRLSCNLPQSDSLPSPSVPAITHTNEDLSVITPPLLETFNIAAYVNLSPTLKTLVDMNVNLSKIEKKPHIFEYILRLDFDKDIKPHIFFLNDYITSEEVTKLLSKNPMILKETLDDLQVRVNYLTSKKFTKSDVEKIISKNPFWLMFSTQRIDKRLGFFQEQFQLKGNEVRMLCTSMPKIITYNLHHIKTNSFVIREEMGFEENEVKKLLLSKPKIWLMDQRSLHERFNYVHNVMNIPHKMIIQNSQILECRLFRIQQRHLFLQKLGRAQYDPKKENYVPVFALATGTDIDFCKTYAKSNVDDFNTFLKTL